MHSIGDNVSTRYVNFLSSISRERLVHDDHDPKLNNV
jgi:hypothetical protein